MPLIILIIALALGLWLTDLLAYVPLTLLYGLRPSPWLTLTGLGLLFVWAFGDAD